MKLLKFFIAKDLVEYGRPVPTKRALPGWYKSAESHFLTATGEKSAGLKQCMPFLDAMITGYVLTIPFDIEVSKKDGNIFFSYPENPLGQIINERPAALGETMPRLPGFAPNHLAFTGFWNFKAPRGFSVLLTHPLNREDLPFHVTSGIIDSDVFFNAGNIPFFIKEDFEGVIPKGTPIAQLIPIKRYDWKMQIRSASSKALRNLGYFAYLARTKDFNYKRTMWHRKKYD